MNATSTQQKTLYFPSDVKLMKKNFLSDPDLIFIKIRCLAI